MNNLVVADIQVRMDNEGRYCLNDLHKAAGGAEKHAPYKWDRRGQIDDLVDELKKTSQMGGNNWVTPISSVGGRNGGTFVVKELVYAYAMWISPAFHLKVIRAYDTLQTQGIAVAEHAAEDLLADPLTYLERVFEQAKKLQAERDLALVRLDEQQPKVEAYDDFMETDSLFSTTDAAKMLGLKSAQALNKILRELRWKHMNSDTPTAYASERDYLTIRARAPEGATRAFSQTFITPVGLDALYEVILN